MALVNIGTASANHYKRGRAAEIRVKELLEGLGYFCVRAAGSKGVCDLVAISTTCYLVQVKRSSRFISCEEWNELWYTAVGHGAVPILADVQPRKSIALWQLLDSRVERGRPPHPMTEWIP